MINILSTKFLVNISGFLVVCFCLPIFFANAIADNSGLEQGLVNPGYQQKPAWFKDSFLDIREDVEEAKADNKRVILYFYQDGCPYCDKLLQDNFGNRGIAEQTQQHF